MGCAPEKSTKKFQFNFSKKILLVVGLFFVVPVVTHGAILGFKPLSGTYSVGQSFSVAVNAGSTTQSLNAVSGSLTFSSDTLEIVGVSKSGSIVNFWAQDPSYSNQTGTASFEGVVLNPGFIGPSGKLVTYTFRVKSAGTGSIKVSKGSILANDGNATEIFSGANTASYTLVPASEKPATVETSVVETSTTQAFLDIKEIPRDNFSTPIVSFSIGVANTKEVFKRYQLSIDQGEPFVWTNESGKDIFTTPRLAPGPHILLVKTLDGSKNLTGYVDFLIDTLEKPKVSYYTRFGITSQPVVVQGTSQASSKVTVVFKKKESTAYTEEITADTNGKFTFLIDRKIAYGKYSMELFANNQIGGMSIHTEPLAVKIIPYGFVRIGEVRIPVLCIGIPLILLAGVSTYFAITHRKKYVELKNKRKESRKKKVILPQPEIPLKK